MLDSTCFPPLHRPQVLVMTGPVRARGELLRFCGQFCKRYGMLMSGQVCVFAGLPPGRISQCPVSARIVLFVSLCEIFYCLDGIRRTYLWRLCARMIGA
jgi:hypothetical protein